MLFCFSSRRRHTRCLSDWSSDVCSSDLGVGGTRNCDWWFTNEAILLDTAGRYTTEDDDRDEWMAFLDQLKKYRSEKPVNGRSEERRVGKECRSRWRRVD